jgi:hypothetical protein
MLVLATLMLGTTAANAGIILGGRTESATTTSDNPCEETTLTGVLSDLASFARTGIILGGRAGIILGGRTSCGTTADRVGIILGG